MSKFLDRTLSDLKPYVPGEQPSGKKYIKLNTNESPFPPAPGVAQILAERSSADDLRLYPDPECRLLKAELASALGVKPENIFLSGGSDEVLDYIFTSFCEHGVIFPDITYGFYRVFADLRQRPFEEIPLHEDFTIDPEDYKVKGKTKIFANPNAPTGIYMPLENIAAIADFDSESLLVIDEAYIDFGGESAVSLIESHPNILVVGTFSKSRSLAGARVGFAVGSADVIRDLETVKFSANPYNISRNSYDAALEAIRDKDYFDKTRNEIIDNREYTKSKLSSLGFSVTDSKTNFLFVKHDALSGRETYLKLKEEGILVRHFPAERTENYLRITIGKKEDMDTLISKLKIILAEAER